MAGRVISGDDAFELHSTHGFFIDITEQMTREVGMTVDRQRFDDRWAIHTDVSGQGRKRHIISAVQGELPTTDDSLKYSVLSTQYSVLSTKATIVAWVKENLVGTGSLACGVEVGLVLDKTNFYAEQGGQVGDAGWIKTDTGTFEVEDTQRLGDSIIHWGKVWEGTIKTGQKATLEVDPLRLDIMRNHTATHLMNWAPANGARRTCRAKGLARRCGEDALRLHARQADDPGGDRRSRTARQRQDSRGPAGDADHDAAGRSEADRGSAGCLRREISRSGARRHDRRQDRPEAATADMSVEFCGGTHLERTSQACLFKIVGQEGVAKGVRRITAVTGPKAVEVDRQLAGVVGELSERFRCRPEELPARIETLQEELKKLQQQLRKGAASDLAGTFDKLLTSAVTVAGVSVIAGEIPSGPDEAIRTQVDRVKQKAGSAVVVVGWADEGKVGLLAAVTDDVIKKGIKAGDLIKQIAPIVGGGGGGRPNMAQAGGKEPAKLGDGARAARRLVEALLTK